MGTEAKRKANHKYDKNHTVRITLRLNIKTDADIIKKLAVQESKQGFIKDSIRKNTPKLQYITGIYALNLACSLDTCGDWHCSSLDWRKVSFSNAYDSVFGLYGLEFNRTIPEHSGTYAVANHIRALLDMLADGQFALAQGMRNDYICTSRYDQEIFEHISLLKDCNNWNNIDQFMGHEYKMKWKKYKEVHHAI